MNGLLDYFKTLNQPNQQGLTFVDRASMNPLLQAGIGILANNTGNYGQFAPTLAKGLGYGLQNVGQYKQQLADNQDRQIQRTLYGQQIDAQMKKAYGDKDEDEIASGIFKTVFQDAGYDPETGGFLPVSADGQMGTSPLSGTPITQDDFTAPKPANPMDSILDELGWSAGRKKFFMSQYKADPKAAMKNLERSYIELDRSNRKGKTEARDVLAKEKAIAEAMGIPVGEYMKQRFDKSGVNVTVQNMLGEPKPVTLPDGSQAFMQFPKGGGAPVLVQGAFPAAGDSEQMAAGYGERMAESEKIIRKVGEKGNPTVATSIAGSVLPGSAGRYVQSKVMTNEQQMHRQAQEDWVRAKLRKESGAVIADEEMEREIATYFPKPGDTPQVIKQKANARDVAIQSMKKAAGPAGQRINAPTGTVRKYNPATGRIE